LRPRALLFDAGNTLVFLDYARLASAVAEALHLPLTEAGLRRHAAAAALAMEQGRLTDRERGSVYLLTLFELAGVPATRIEELKSALLDLHQRAHLWGATAPGTRAALERLRDAGFRLAVISNSDGRAASALEAARLRDLFEFVIDSGEVGVEKPDPRIFRLALDRLGLDAGETMYVGDLYEVDAIGARSAGIEPVLLDPDGVHAGRDVETVASIAALADRLLAPCAA
jgi:HAD superfamily hydrolase (TIGR01509 family)